MAVIKYHKLVRDKIPQIIEAAGKTCKTEILPEEEYRKMIDEKMAEELKEYQEENQSDKKLEELADLLEVVYAAAEARGCSLEELEAIRKKKADKNGAFKEKILLVEVMARD